MNIRKRTWNRNGTKHTAWVVDARGHGNKRRQFPTKAEAELYHDKLIRQRYAEEYQVPLDATISLKDFLDIYEKKKSWRTESYRARTMSALGLVPFRELPIARVTSQVIEDYRDRRLKTSQPSTVRQDLAAL